MGTRGRFILLTDTGYLASYEANGDMYFHVPGHGHDAAESIARVHNREEFIPMLEAFNKRRQNHVVANWYTYISGNCGRLNIGREFACRYVDYSFIKNASSEDVVLEDAKHRQAVIKPGEVIAAYFGDFYNEDIPEKYTAKVIE